MPEYSKHQKKIIQRYYDNRDAISLAKLGELVSELYLADTPGKADRLWKRVETAMTALKVAPRLMEHILTERKPEVLAANLKDWLRQGEQPRP